MKWIQNCDGVAMTEGIIVVPFLLLVWSGLSALAAIYLHRLDIEAWAAAQVMDMASAGNCSDVSEESVPGAEPLADREAGLLSRLGGTNPLVMAHSRATVSQQVSDLPSALNGGTVRLSTGRIMMCNTRPVDGLMDLIVADVRAMLGV